MVLTREVLTVQQAAPRDDADSARAALVEASKSIDLDASDAELVRLGSNAVFRFRAAPVIGRVARSKQLAAARREIRVSAWLTDVGIPAVRALDVQPVVAKGRVVTFWKSATDTVSYGTTRELAGLLRNLHSLESPPFEMPGHDPIGRAGLGLLDSDGLSAADRDFIAERLERLADIYAHIEPELPRGVIHGDANVGNVIRDRAGRPIFADLDNFAVGPREWDLVLTALYFERFGWHTEQEYRDLVTGYGYDIMQWSGYPVMRDVRELLMVIWLAKKASTDADAVAQLAIRINGLRTNSSRRDWKPF